jgi:hypothetical protein
MHINADEYHQMELIKSENYQRIIANEIVNVWNENQHGER